MAFALALQSVHDLPEGHGQTIFTATTAIVVLTVDDGHSNRPVFFKGIFSLTPVVFMLLSNNVSGVIDWRLNRHHA